MSLTGAGVTAMLAAVQCSLNEDATTGPRCLLLPPLPHWPRPGFSDMRMTPPPTVAQHLLGAGRRPRERHPGLWWRALRQHEQGHGRALLDSEDAVTQW